MPAPHTPHNASPTEYIRMPAMLAVYPTLIDNPTAHHGH
jgi:hypothetical protein